jgi:hypothetical protein
MIRGDAKNTGRISKQILRYPPREQGSIGNAMKRWKGNKTLTGHLA